MYFEREQQVIKSKTVKMPSIFICIQKLLTNDRIGNMHVIIYQAEYK